MTFNDADRKFIMKIANAQKAAEKRIKALEDSIKPGATGADVLSPLNMKPMLKHAGARKSLVESLFGGPAAPQSVEIIFKDKSDADAVKQRILIESLYRTLKELCDKNGIETLQIRIDNLAK